MTARQTLAVVAVVGGLILAPAAVWGVSVAVSGVKGQGDAIVKRNSAANWTAAQARFEGLYQEVLAADRKVDLSAAALAANPSDLTLSQTYSGIVSGCMGIVADYNADARSYLAQDFRAADLPAQIDNFDPATNCKESA